jgi:hypothetical protein
MVDQIVGRLHVGEPFKVVIDTLRAAMAPTFRAECTSEARARRKAIYRAGILAHLKNRNFYDSLYGSGMSELEEEITTRLYGGTRA